MPGGLIFLDAYEPDAGGFLVSAMNAAGLHLKLFKNNYTPVDGSVAGNFTEADFSGYAAVAVTMGNAGEISGKEVMEATVPAVFTHSSGGTTNTIYGYYVQNDTTGVVMWAERFGTSVNMAVNGDTLSIQLQLTLDSANH